MIGYHARAGRSLLLFGWLVGIPAVMVETIFLSIITTQPPLRLLTWPCPLPSSLSSSLGAYTSSSVGVYSHFGATWHCECMKVKWLRAGGFPKKQAYIPLVSLPNLLVNTVTRNCLLIEHNVCTINIREGVWSSNRWSLTTDWATGVRSPPEANICPLACVQTNPEVHPASCAMGAGGYFLGGKLRPGRETDHLPHLVPRMGKS
jgi:hypothetical protein